MKQKHVTIKDIAKELGVHHTTVSLALRNSPLLKDETRERIQAKATQMDYRPNRLAQGFRRRSSLSIGVIVPVIHRDFFSRFISELMQLASVHGYTIVVMQSNENRKTEEMNISTLIEYRVAGVIASISKGSNDWEHFQILKKEGIPLVFFDRVPDDFKGASVVVNNYQLAHDSVNLMIKKGRKRIAFIIGSSLHNVSSERIRGYKDALEKNQISIDKNLLVKSGHDIMSGSKAAKRLMSIPAKPDGILAINDRIAMGAMKYLKKSGFRIPEDIGVIGFDNDPMGLAVEPELTTCKQPIKEMADASLRLLLDQIQGRKSEESKIIIEGNILIRNSC